MSSTPNEPVLQSEPLDCREITFRQGLSMTRMHRQPRNSQHYLAQGRRNHARSETRRSTRLLTSQTLRRTTQRSESISHRRFASTRRPRDQRPSHLEEQRLANCDHLSAMASLPSTLLLVVTTTSSAKMIINDNDPIQLSLYDASTK